MKVLHYYWTPYNIGLGGGVSIYLNNILPALSKNHQVDFLSSGYYYDPSLKKCYIEKLEELSSKEISCFTVINSPILSPGHDAWQSVDTFLEDVTLLNVLKTFISEQGKYDVIHFHSFEGLTQKALTLKKYFPRTKFIWSVHNYHAFCPQVNLWKREKKCCEDYVDGTQCTNCIFTFTDVKKLRYLRFKELVKVTTPTTTLSKIKRTIRIIKRKYFLKTYKEVEGYRQNRVSQVYGRKDIMFSTDTDLIKDSSEKYKKYREGNVRLINKYFHKVLAVSNRVGEICIEDMGIKSELVETQYISTKFEQKPIKKYTKSDGSITIAYLGYTRKDKGFFFFKKCLKNAPDHLAKKIRVVIASSMGHNDLLYKLEQISIKFKGFTVYNGYGHDSMGKILKTVDLGVVPVLWEDNLPQVSIEMKSFGVPVLASDRGGASEISSVKNRQYFRFKSNDANDFWSKVEQFIEDPKRLKDYWFDAPSLISAAEHAESISAIYSNINIAEEIKKQP